LARIDESIAAFNQRFIFPLPFAMKIIKINLWNQGKHFATKLCNFTNFNMLLLAVVMDFVLLA
jgi:hypothetical protein